jgi:hypothetical protein
MMSQGDQRKGSSVSRDDRFNVPYMSRLATPAYRFIVEQRGYSHANIVGTRPLHGTERLKGKDRYTGYLNNLLFGPRDYAISARRM